MSAIHPPNVAVNDDEIMIWVGSASDAKQVSNYLVMVYNEQPTKRVILRAIGAGAVNQAIKTVIIANSSLVKWGVVADIRPSFLDVSEKLTSIVMKLNFIKI